MTGLTALLLVGMVIALGLVILLITKNPSLTRDWSPDQEIMPKVKFLDNNRMHIKNIRDINYRTTRDYDLDHYDREIAIDDVETAWLAISPFGGPGIAHTFLSFGLKDGSYIAVSIEVRRKKGEKFAPVKAFMRHFEIMYVIANETDVIRVRTNCAKAIVRLFPIQTEKHVIQSVFIDVLKRADKLGKEPEFYNTIWNNCTTNIIKHAKRFSKKPIPNWSLRYLFPESIDKIAYRLNILDTHLPFDDAREKFDITSIAQATEPDEDFSAAIRNHINLRSVD